MDDATLKSTRPDCGHAQTNSLLTPHTTDPSHAFAKPTRRNPPVVTCIQTGPLMPHCTAASRLDIS